MHEERDETIERVRAALKPLPPKDALAVARVLSAVHGRNPQPTPWWREAIDWLRMPTVSVAAVGGVAVAALFVGYALNDTSSAPSFRGPNSAAPSVADAGSTPSNSSAVSSAVVPMVAASSAAGAERLIPVQFVFDFPSASTVIVAGDFNEWSMEQSPMQKDASGAWTITIPVKAGRHEYSFVVDGKTWMADPRALKGRDDDFGKPGSVIVVSPP